MVDDKYHAYFSQPSFRYTLDDNGYPLRRAVDMPIRLHIEVAQLEGLSTAGHIHHIDRNRLNAQGTNLRPLSHNQNLALQRKPRTKKTPSSIYKCVCCDKRSAVWVVYVRGVYGGSYQNEINAALAADALMVKIYGEFALTNKMLGLVP